MFLNSIPQLPMRSYFALSFILSFVRFRFYVRKWMICCVSSSWSIQNSIKIIIIFFWTWLWFLWFVFCIIKPKRCTWLQHQMAFLWELEPSIGNKLSGIELGVPRICIIICNHTRYTGYPGLQKKKKKRKKLVLVWIVFLAPSSS